jgi:hypothetical protein
MVYRFIYDLKLGLDIKILQTVLTAAFQFLVYEKIHTFMLVLLRNSDVGKKH